MRLLFLVMLSILCCFTPVPAQDRIVLKDDGRVVTGKILEQTDSHVKIRSGEMMLQIGRDRIASLQKNIDASPPPIAQAGEALPERADPAQLKGKVAEALVLCRKGRAAEAEHLFKWEVGQGSGMDSMQRLAMAEIHTAIAENYRERFNPEPAEKHIGLALAHKPDYPPALRVQAELWQARGQKHGESAAVFGQQLKANPNDAKLNAAYADALIGKQAWLEAVAPLKRLQEHPEYVKQGYDKKYRRALTEAMRDGMRMAPTARLAVYQDAAEAGSVKGAYLAAQMLDEGGDIPVNERAATQYYLRAARAGDVRAIYRLGQRFQTGEGVEANRDYAVHWLGAAANYGHAGARQELAREVRANHPAALYYEGSLLLAESSERRGEAAALLRRSAELGFEPAKARLAEVEAVEREIAANIQTARRKEELRAQNEAAQAAMLMAILGVALGMTAGGFFDQGMGQNDQYQRDLDHMEETNRRWDAEREADRQQDLQDQREAHDEWVSRTNGM